LLEPDLFGLTADKDNLVGWAQHPTVPVEEAQVAQ
jgi:hypothetical protein